MATSFRRIVLVNPPWSFEGSHYWACTEPHLPLELLYCEALLKRSGFDAHVVDAHLEGLSLESAASRVKDLHPDLVVLTTAPTYLFWRCPPPELDVPAAVTGALGSIAPVVAVGPHGSATPHYTLDTLGCAAVIRGEPEEELLRLVRGQPGDATIWRGQGDTRAGDPAGTDMASLPVLELRTHRHHVFWGDGRGAEVEFSRGCPYGCIFCNRRYFRSRYRERPLERLLAELRTLRARGVDYVYFIDEVFGLGRGDALLDALAEERPMQFGCQTRIDLWDEQGLDRLAAAGCISVEFGLESPFPEVQVALRKGYRMDADRILQLMVHAKERIPWVQGDLVEPPEASPDLQQRTEEWRQEAINRGVWVSRPVRLFLYPGSDLFDQRVGPVGDDAWLLARRQMDDRRAGASPGTAFPSEHDAPDTGRADGQASEGNRCES